MQFGMMAGGIGYDPNKSVYKQVEGSLKIAKAASKLHYTHLMMAQHWIAYPEVWMQPIPMLARLSAVSGKLILTTSIIQMPLYNPVDIAEQVSTMDHITNGRFVLGIGNGYREVELEAAGTNRRERAPRVEESIEIMKRLWAGEDLDFKGRFWNVKGRMALTPVQKPGPPIEIAVHAEGAARRAARLAEGALLAPQIYWEDLKRLAAAYEDECAKVGRRGTLGTHRSVAIAKDRKTAEELAQRELSSHVNRYQNWDMQEQGMVDIHISGPNDPSKWVILGSPDECAEQISRLIEEFNLDYLDLMPSAMPKELPAQLEMVQFLSEEVLSKVG